MKMVTILHRAQSKSVASSDPSSSIQGCGWGEVGDHIHCPTAVTQVRLSRYFFWLKTAKYLVNMHKPICELVQAFWGEM